KVVARLPSRVRTVRRDGGRIRRYGARSLRRDRPGRVLRRADRDVLYLPRAHRRGFLRRVRRARAVLPSGSAHRARRRRMIPLRDDIPSSRVPVVNFTLLGACLLVFLWQLSLGPEGFERAVFSLGVIPATLLGDAELPAELRLIPPEATIFTSMFMHGGLLHLAGN